MRIGIPTEIKLDEHRVAITPSGVAALTARPRGGDSGGRRRRRAIPDRAFEAAGALVVESADAVWERSEMILKVKEPLEPEFERMRRGQILFTYLHLRASKELTRSCSNGGWWASATRRYSSPTARCRSWRRCRRSPAASRFRPAPRRSSGWRAAKASCCPGVSGVRRGRVTIIGAGVVGLNACVVGVGFGADVTILRHRSPAAELCARRGPGPRDDADVERREHRGRGGFGRSRSVLRADPRCPHAASGHPRPPRAEGAGVGVGGRGGRPGGCAETSRPTTHRDPRYVEEGVITTASRHARRRPHTSTYALTNATMTYALEIADRGWRGAAKRDPALAGGVNVVDGQVTHQAVAAAHGLDWMQLADVSGADKGPAATGRSLSVSSALAARGGSPCSTKDVRRQSGRAETSLTSNETVSMML